MYHHVGAARTHSHYLTRDDTIFTGMEARGKGVVGGGVGGILSSVVFISPLVQTGPREFLVGTGSDWRHLTFHPN